MKSRLTLLLTAPICLSGLVAPRQAVEVASDATTSTGHACSEIRADLLIGQANAADYAAIAVIGGTGAKDLLWEHRLHTHKGGSSRRITSTHRW